VDTKQAGKLGGEARAKNLSPRQLTAIGKKGARIRWAKRPRYVKPRKGTA